MSRFITSILVCHMQACAWAVELPAPVAAASTTAPKQRVQSITWTSSWLGNSFSGGTAANRGMAGGDLGDAIFVQNRHEDMFVTADGTVVMNTHWDEGHHEVGIYRNGKCIGHANETGGGRGGFDVTSDNQFIYAGLALDWSFKERGVARFSMTGEAAGWPGARSGSRMAVGTTRGMACSDGELFVSDDAGRIVVIKTADMSILREFSIERPGKIAINPRDKTLWMLRERKATDAASEIIHLDRQGKVLPERITDVVHARGLAFNPKTGQLGVSENGPDQQVVFYSVTGTPKKTATFGVKGGVMAGPNPGRASDDRLCGPAGLGFDAAGNLYVTCTGSTPYDGLLLRAFDPQGKVLWRLHGLMFVDCVSIDPADDQAVFSKDERFILDPRQAPGADWKLAGYLHDQHRYSMDFPSGNTAVVCRIAGKRILYTLDMNGSQIGIYRFDGDLAVPCGVMTSAGTWKNSPEGRCQWRDVNGDQRVDASEWTHLSPVRDGILGRPDAAGNLWHGGWGTKIRLHQCQGLDAHGAPLYTKESIQEFPAPTGMTNVDRVSYQVDTDTLYVSGNTADKPRLFDEGQQFITGGRVIARVDGWLKAGNRNPTWIVDTVRYDAGHDMKSFAVAGDLLFTVERQTSLIDVFDAASGIHLQQLVPGPELGPVANHIFADLPYSISAHRCRDGSTIVFQEDDVYGKNIVWRILTKTKSSKP